MVPSIYINLEDDVSKIVERLRRQSAREFVLVCPKRCFLFNDSINLRLLKKQLDLLGKQASILTMDERGQMYAREAGFKLKFLPKINSSRAFSDVRPAQRPQPQEEVQPKATDQELEQEWEEAQASTFAGEVKGLGQLPKKIMPLAEKEEPEIQTRISSTVTQYEDQEPEPLQPLAQEPIIPLEVAVTDNIFAADEENVLEQKPKKSHGQKVIFSLLGVCIILVLVLAFVVLPKATVVVYPKTEPVTRDMDISLSANATSSDPSALILPATKVDENVTVNDKFQSQGKNQVGNKADGTVKIYNFTRLPINLKAATTVLMVGNKTYNLVNDVVDLKPATYSNARTKEVDPNSLGASVEVTASQGGDDYNLPAGTRMEITNQVFGSKPQLLYAKTDTEIAGGTTRYLSVISQDDSTAAQKQLQDEALRQIQAKLQQSGLVLTDGAYSITVSQFTMDNPVGTQTPSFQASLQARITGLAFSGGDLQKLIFQRIGQTLSTNTTLTQSQPGDTTYKIQSLDLSNQLAVLSAHFQGLAVFNINLANITPQLVNKSQTQVNEILSSQGQIDHVDITLAPSWQKNFPLFARKISLTVATPTASQ